MVKFETFLVKKTQDMLHALWRETFMTSTALNLNKKKATYKNDAQDTTLGALMHSRKSVEKM